MKKMNKMYAAPKAEMIALEIQTPVLGYSYGEGTQPGTVPEDPDPSRI
jgi:hypothetical protein